MKIKEADAAKSSMLIFGLTKDLSLKYIYNLSRKFGDISFITENKKMAFVKFRTLEFAATARNYLNKKSLVGNFLSLIPQLSPRSLAQITIILLKPILR